MIQEEKQLLIKDICARLLYHPRINVCNDSWEGCQTGEFDTNLYSHHIDAFVCDRIEVKPYLRPMSSMTKEEGKELEHLLCEIDAPCWVDTEYGCVNFAGGNDFIDTEMAEIYVDWLNENMFDYRGLIPMGLALEAPEDMYKTE